MPRRNINRRPPRKRPRRTVKRKAGGDMFVNSSIAILALLIIGLTYSWIDRQFLTSTTAESFIPTITEPTTITSRMWMEKKYRDIHVEVLNGCGIDGVAKRMTEFLRDRGFDVVKTDNAVNADYMKTVVKDRGGNLSLARRLAEELEIDTLTVMQELNPSLQLDVTVILGQDYTTLPPFISDAADLP